MLPNRSFVNWLFETWAWLRAARPTPTSLIRPTSEDFPVDLALHAEDLAEDYFLFVREHVGLRETRLRITARDHQDDSIPYDLAMLQEPEKLVAHFVRGAAHHWVRATTTQPPVNEDEYLLDATTIFFGFGIFAANTRSSFDRHMPMVFRRDAMGEHEVAFALALFGILNEIPDRDIEQHLNPNPRAFYRKSVKHLLRHHAAGLDRLQGRQPADIGPYR